MRWSEHEPAAGAAMETLEHAGRIVRRTRLSNNIKYICDLVAVAAVGLAAAVALDAWGGFAPVGRATLLAAWAAAVGSSALWWYRARGFIDAARLAGAGAGRCGLDGASVAAAIEFAQRPTSADALADALRGRAIERGLAMLRSVDPSSAVDTRPAWLAMGRCAIVMAVIALATLFSSGAAMRGALRILAPTGDHPPWSPTGLRVEIEPPCLFVGDDALVRVLADRGPTGGLDLVIRSEDGATQRLPIGSAGDAEDGLDLVVRVSDVREALRVRAERAGARSRWVWIRPEARPRVERAIIEIIPPEYTGWSASTIPVDTGINNTRLGAIAGSRARMTAWLTMDVIARADGADAESSAGRAIYAEWFFAEPGAQRVVLDAETPAGVRLSAPIVAEIDFRADHPPMIQYQGAEMLDGGEARLGVVARDDVALESLIAERLADAGGEWLSLGMSVAPTGGAWSGLLVVTAESLGLAPGGRAFVRFRARDARPIEFGGQNETVAGPIEIIAGSGGGEDSLHVSDAISGVVFGGSFESNLKDDVAGPGAASGDDEPGMRSPSDDERTKEGGGDRTGGVGGASRDGSTAGDAGSEYIGETRSGEMRELGAFDPLGGVRALEFMSSGRGALSRGIEPSLLNSLGGRHREIAARYFELLTSRSDRIEQANEVTP